MERKWPKGMVICWITFLCVCLYIGFSQRDTLVKLPVKGTIENATAVQSHKVDESSNVTSVDYLDLFIQTRGKVSGKVARMGETDTEYFIIIRNIEYNISFHQWNEVKEGSIYNLTYNERRKVLSISS